MQQDVLKYEQMRSAVDAFYEATMAALEAMFLMVDELIDMFVELMNSCDDDDLLRLLEELP